MGMTSTRSLITGGGGFIGRHLVRLLLERGESVRILELEDVEIENPEIEVIRGSICERDTVSRALNGVDRLYHLAANPNLWDIDKNVFMKVNYEGTRVVLEEAARFDLDRIIYTSTESILKDPRSKRERSRGKGIRPDKLELEDMPGPYCRSKYLAEQHARAASRNGQPVVIVSPTMPVGPGDRNLTPPTKMILGFLNGSTPAYLNCGLNLVDVRDVACGHLLAAERGRIGEQYILGNENLTLQEILLMIQELTGITPPRLQIPYWIALAFSFISEFMADHITHRPPMAPLTGVRLARDHMFFESRKAVQELGFVQTPIRKALADSIDWLIDKGLVMNRIRRPGEAAFR